MSQPFPLDCDAALLRETWLAATPAERQELCIVDGDNELLHLKVEEALLKVELSKAYDSAAKRKDALAAEMRKHGLDQVEWTMQRPRSACMSLKFCNGPLNCDLIISRAHRDFEAFLVSSTTRWHSRDATETRTWEDLRKDLYTLIFVQAIGRCRRRRNGDLILLLHAVETLEASSTVRLWPSRRNLAAMRTVWTALTPEERIEACAVRSAARWVVRACEMMAGTCMTKVCLRTGVLRGGDLESAEYKRLRLNGVEGAACQSKHEAVQLTLEFASWAGALDHILKHAVKTSPDKETVTTIAALASQAAISVAQTDLSTELQIGWKHVARLTFTLILAAFEIYMDKRQSIEAEALQAREVEAARLRQKAEARKNARRKKLEAAKAAKVATASAALERAAMRKGIKTALPDIDWECDAYVHIIRTFIDTDDYDVSEEAHKLRRCHSAPF